MGKLFGKIDIINFQVTIKYYIEFILVIDQVKLLILLIYEL